MRDTRSWRNATDPQQRDDADYKAQETAEDSVAKGNNQIGAGGYSAKDEKRTPFKGDQCNQGQVRQSINHQARATRRPHCLRPVRQTEMDKGSTKQGE